MKKIAKEEILEFVEELTEFAKKGEYISVECIKNFAKDYTNNFDSEEYKNAGEDEFIPFVFMTTENCWLSRKQIKDGIKCEINNEVMVEFVNNQMQEAIKKGEFTFKK